MTNFDVKHGEYISYNDYGKVTKIEWYTHGHFDCELDVTDGEKVLVQYQGACGSCGSSLGATLSFMESTLRKHVYNEINVVPQV